MKTNLANHWKLWPKEIKSGFKRKGLFLAKVNKI
jgi:hypothetical protein